MSFTFNPYDPKHADIKTVPNTKTRSTEADDVLMTNPTACLEMERYWASLPRVRGVPLRKDVDPSAMAGLLEDSFILERVAPGVGRIRVAGRNLVKLLAMEPRGLPLTAAFLPADRAAMAAHLEAAFTTPSIVELALASPRAVGQPQLNGKILLLPLRDDHGQISRVLGLLVMSGRRGLGGRRFTLSDESTPRIDPVIGLYALPSGPRASLRPNLRLPDRIKAGDRPALRLIVSNDL